MEWTSTSSMFSGNIQEIWGTGGPPMARHVTFISVSSTPIKGSWSIWTDFTDTENGKIQIRSTRNAKKIHYKIRFKLTNLVQFGQMEKDIRLPLTSSLNCAFNGSGE